MIEKRCECCDQGFQAKRADARYCSARCRLRAFRARNVSESVSSDAEVVSEPKRKPKSQLAYDIETAKAYVAWRRANYEEREL